MPSHFDVLARIVPARTGPCALSPRAPSRKNLVVGFEWDHPTFDQTSRITSIGSL